MGNPIGYYCNNTITPVLDLEDFCGGNFDYLSEAELIYVIKGCVNGLGDDNNVRPYLIDLVQTLVNRGDKEVLAGIATAGLDNLEISSCPKKIQEYVSSELELTQTLIQYWGEHLADASLQESAKLLSIISCAVGVDFDYVEEQSRALAQSLLQLDKSSLINTLQGLVWMPTEEREMREFAQNAWVDEACNYYGIKLDDAAFDELGYWVCRGCEEGLIKNYQFSDEEGTALEEIRDIAENEDLDTYDTFAACRGIADLMRHKYLTQSEQYAA